MSVSVRERDPDTDQRAAAFPQPGRTRGEEEERGVEAREGGWRQREQSIPPTGCTWSYRLVHTVPSNQHSTNLTDFILKPVKLIKLFSRYNFLKTSGYFEATSTVLPQTVANYNKLHILDTYYLLT